MEVPLPALSQVVKYLEMSIKFCYFDVYVYICSIVKIAERIYDLALTSLVIITICR